MEITIACGIDQVAGIGIPFGYTQALVSNVQKSDNDEFGGDGKPPARKIEVKTTVKLKVIK